MAEELSEEESKILKHLNPTHLEGLKESESAGSGRILIRDQDYADEIAHLEASTRRYTAQAEALAAQRQSLLRFSHSSRSSTSRGVNRAQVYSQAALRDAQYAKSLNDDTINEVKDRLQTASTSLEALSKALPSLVAGRLKAHDRAISGLEADLIATPNDANASLPDNSRIELLAAALSKHRADLIRGRLDRIFLHHLSNAAEDEGSDSTCVEEVQALENDIQALYIEIDDICTMLVSQEHLQPLRHSIHQERSKRAAVKANKYYNAIQTLDVLTNQVSSWHEHARTVRSGLLLHRHLKARLTQIESETNTTALRSPAPAPAPALRGESKLQLATERCLSSHILRVSGDTGPITTATTTTNIPGGKDQMLHLLESAVSARATAVESLNVAAQTSTPHSSTFKLDRLQARVSEAQRLLHESQPAY